MAAITLLEAIRQGLWEEMERDERVFILGEDVGVYGGAFKMTEGFLAKFADLRKRDCRRGLRRSDDGHAPSGRDAVH